MDANTEKLREDYLSDKIVPFIGAGLSVPFEVPTWKMLIQCITQKYAVGKVESLLKGAVGWHLENNDYWGAIDELKKYAQLVDQDIQSEIVKLIKARKISLKNDDLHNYSDIGKMNFKLHLTTNYENLLYEYVKCDDIPILLKDMDFSTQDMFDDKRICHLHGNMSNPGSIVISRSSYEKLYEDKKYDNLLKVVTGSRKLLFMGFSFDDQFVSTLIKHHRDYFKGMHYILLASPTNEKIRELKDEYGLITISYQKEGSSHTQEIRRILNYIAKPLAVKSEDDDAEMSSVGTAKPIIVGAGVSDMNQNVEENLFYKKLKLENIEPTIIKLSSIFYIASERYIRELRNAGMSLEVIDALLGKVFAKYLERYADTYNKYGDSQMLLGVVHSSLEKIDFGRYAQLFKDNKSDENENRGLIHLIAEDEEKEVWWGEKRLDE
ncbi:SIR2 family protein [Brevibacillus brevis]|uniref:ABC-three component system protein n=1 Tax=Brevibacillus brevis TaxID=1393 RepID=UPI000B374477|nr:ABC-three component system protein [Brevibacillus brevis]OUQ85222.1 SIR2 family protein [Brevibacillus brevis]